MSSRIFFFANKSLPAHAVRCIIRQCREACLKRLPFLPAPNSCAPPSRERRRLVARLGFLNRRRAPMIASVPNPPHDARSKRMIAALVDGADLDAIAAQERLPAEGGPGDPARRAQPALGRAGRGLRQNPDRPAGKPLPACHGPGRQRRHRGGRPGAPDHRPARPLPWVPAREPRPFEPYGEEERERLLAKINEAAVRLYSEAAEPRSRP